MRTPEEIAGGLMRGDYGWEKPLVQEVADAIRSRDAEILEALRGAQREYIGDTYLRDSAVPLSFIESLLGGKS